MDQIGDKIITNSPRIFDTVVALDSVMFLKKYCRTMSVKVTAEREFSPEDIVLKSE